MERVSTTSFSAPYTIFPDEIILVDVLQCSTSFKSEQRTTNTDKITLLWFCMFTESSLDFFALRMGTQLLTVKLNQGIYIKMWQLKWVFKKQMIILFNYPTVIPFFVFRRLQVKTGPQTYDRLSSWITCSTCLSRLVLMTWEKTKGLKNLE
jgi:hypothetical protein